MALQLEDVEVATRYVHGDVVHRHAADRAFEAAAVGVAVQDDVGTVFRDRGSKAVAAEIRPDSLRLAVQRVGCRRVMQEHNADGAMRYLLQASTDGVHLFRRLRVYLPKQRLPEVRQLRAAETADEALRPHYADLLAVELEHDRLAIEHAQTGPTQ